MRQRTSPIWKMSSEEFVRLVGGNTEGAKGLLVHFGLRCAGHNYKTLKARIVQEGLDWKSLSEQWRRHLLDRIHTKSRRPLADFLKEGSSYCRASLKRRLIEEGVLENKCSRCGQESEWFGGNLVFILDHINGIHDDNRPENLRLLCPNCNSQQATFAGRNNRGKKAVEEKTCADCGTKILRNSTRCTTCSHKIVRRVERPDMDVLRKEVDEIGWEATGRKYGVSGNAVKKWFYC